MIGGLDTIERSTCALRVVAATFFALSRVRVCKLTVRGRERSIRGSLAVSSSFKYGRIGGDHDKEGQRRVTNQNFVVM